MKVMDMSKWSTGKFLLLFFITCFMINIPVSNAQDFSSLFWLFGQSKFGITYKKSDFTSQLDSIQNPAFGIGGSAVATDPYSGELMFYTDGILVYDRGHQLISNYSAGLNGASSSNQHAVVTSSPSQANQYWIIANTATPTSPGIINASKINMNQQGNAPTPNIPKYGVMQNPFNTGVTNNASEGMIVIANPAGTKYWLITHERGTARFKVTPVTSVGIEFVNTVTFDFTANGILSMNVANLSYNQVVRKIAVSPQDTSRNVQVLNFSNFTGVLSYDTTIFNSANTDISANPADNYSIYDTEWSPDGTKLYISRHGGNGTTGMVYQYDLNTASFTLVPIFPNPVFRSYGLKIGPDNNIYHLYQAIIGGPFLIGRISNADSSSASVIYTPAFFGNVDFNGRQFPETLPYQKPNFLNAGFDFYGGCYGTSTKFFPKINPPAEKYSWNFGDGNSSNLISPVHKYNQAGTYPITLTATVNGRDTVIIGQVIISQSDTLALRSSKGSILPTDTTICQGETLLLDASKPAAISYLWSVPGVTASTYTVDSAGYYWAIATYNVPGGTTCTSYDAINVTVYKFQLQVANQWYFGDHAGIDFNKQPAVPLLNGAMNAPAGCAAISDRNGKILFYTDGNVVFGRTGEILGQNIGGDNTASQSAIAVPFPQDETMYYIFTTKEVYGDNTYMLNYAVLDIKEPTNNDPGKVPPNLMQIPLYTKNTERITAIGGYGNNATLVAHEYGNNTFRFYPITSAGIGPPLLQSIGSIHEFGSDISADGYMKFSPNGTMLAVALVSNGKNFVDLFDRDTSGTLSNFRQITFQETYPQFQVYGVEFSPTSNKLFVSLSGFNSLIYEFRLDSADIVFINATRNQLATENLKFGALQTGPDGQIYVAVDNGQQLARISPNPSPTQPSTYTLNGFDLSGKLSKLGLPNFIQNLSIGLGSPTASVTGFCVGQPTTLSGQASSSIDVFHWQVKNQADSIIFVSDQLADTLIIQKTGDYVVTFSVSNRCGYDTMITQNITIKPTPPPPTLPDAFAICTGSEILEALPVGSTGYNYLWNNGSTGRTINVINPGVYSVIISYQDPTLGGCTSDSSTFVVDGRPQFNLGPDLTLCQNSVAANLATGLNPTSYAFEWRINGGLSPDTTTSHPVSTAIIGNFRYTVKVDDRLTKCFRRDTITITIGSIPNASFTITSSTCGLSNGSITVSGAPVNSSIFLFNSNGILQPQLTGLPAGSYTLMIQDQINGCSKSFNPIISDQNPGFTIIPTTVPGCISGQIQVELVSETYPVNYQLTGTNNNQNLSGNIIADDPNPAYAFIINGIQPGTFNLQIISGGCTFVQPAINLVKPLTSGLDILPNYPNCQTTLTINPDQNGLFPGQTYSWIGPGVPSPPSNVGPALVTSRGGSFSVTAQSAGKCDTTAAFVIDLFVAPIVQIDSSGNGCGSSVQLTANVTNTIPGETYSYLWTNSEVTKTITLPSPVNTDSKQYANNSVTVVNQQNGCQSNAGPVDVTTYLPFAVFLTSTIACDDGKPVSVTANILNINQNNIDSYSWTGPEPNINTLTTQTILVNIAGDYTATAKWNVCEESATMKIIRSPVTKPDILPYYSVCTEPPASESVILTPGNFVSYSILNLSTNQVVPEFQPGTYELTDKSFYEGTGLNGFGCLSIDTFEIDVQCIAEVYAPNAFSPSATIPKNQTFSVDGLYIDEASFQIAIYNRWGEVVYESNNRGFTWDGTSKNGTPLPLGTYAYLIRYRSITDTDKPYKEKRGGVLILR